MAETDRLAAAASEVLGMRFSYEVEESQSPEYWGRRAGEFARYSSKAAEYYAQAHRVMAKYDAREAGVFLVYTARFGQIAQELLGTMEEIGRNPSVMGGGQQSGWSRGIRDRLAKYSRMCLDQERDMSSVFRSFCQRHSV